MSTNFFDLVNFGTILNPKALCPLAEPLLPDSTVAAGVKTTGLTTEPTACLLEGEGGLRRRKTIKKQTQDPRKAIVRTHLSMLPAEAALRFRVFPESTAGSSAARSWTSDAVRLADRPGNKIQQRSIEDQTFQSEQDARQKEVRATLESVCANGTSSGSGGLL